MNEDQKKCILGALADIERTGNRLKSTINQDLSLLSQIEQDAITATGIENVLIAAGHFIAMVGMSQVLSPSKNRN